MSRVAEPNRLDEEATGQRPAARQRLRFRGSIQSQETLLFLPRTERGRDPIHLRQLQPLAAVLNWGQQRSLWRALQANSGRICQAAAAFGLENSRAERSGC